VSIISIRRDIMDKRKIKTMFLVILTIMIFGLSYYICINRLNLLSLKSINYKGEKLYNSNTMAVHSNLDTVVSASADIIFKIKYNKSGDVAIENQISAGELAGKTKNELEQIYRGKGYKVQSITQKEVVLIREVDKYAPNKYVLGIKDGFIAIFKTDKDGNMFIQNEKTDITDIKIDKLKSADIKLLTKGDKYFQCNSRYEAESRLEDYQ
jgi:hypothetical protein